MLCNCIIGVRCINTYEVMRSIVTICLGVLLVLPCLLVLNESDNVDLNIVGLMYSFVFVLCVKYHERFKAFRRFISRTIERYTDKSDF